MITKTRIMANPEYSISSSSSCEKVANNTSSSILSSTSISDTTLCNCQQRAVSSSSNNNCSSSSRRRRSEGSSMISSSSTMMPINNPVFLIMSLLVFISYFTCCVSAWPILNHRRTYAPPSVALADYNDLVDMNQWAVAAQPDNYYDTLPVLPQQIQQDVYDDEQFYDQQEPEEETYQMPAYFGPIMDPVEPEEELELEQLKHQQPYMYEKRRAAKVTATLKPATLPSSTSSHPASTPAPSASPSSTASSSHPTSSSSTSSKAKVAAGQPHLAVSPLQKNSISNGQKEIAMLRPPSSGKSHYIQLDEPEEPKISVAQRSPSNEKPSAYDRLRQYLSLDDALKKEYQQRRASAMSRHHAKRESISSIITDSDNLTGQLNNLKKEID